MDAEGINGLGKVLGRMEAKIDANDERCARIEANQDLMRTELQAHGVAIATVQRTCRLRAKDLLRRDRKISDLNRKFAEEDITGRIHLAEHRARWWTLTKLGAILLGILGAAATIWGLFRGGK